MTPTEQKALEWLRRLGEVNERLRLMPTDHPDRFQLETLHRVTQMCVEMSADKLHAEQPDNPTP